MANLGGGLIIVGRDEPDFITGTLDDRQARSFDVTDLNKFVHRYLTPALECAVTVERVDDDRLAVIDVPSFDGIPLIFKVEGHCSDEKHRKTPHFGRADIYMRGKAMESHRIVDPEEMRELLAIASRAQRDEIMEGLRRQFESMLETMRTMLNVSPVLMSQPPIVAPPSAPVEPANLDIVTLNERKHDDDDRDFFRSYFFPWLFTHGHYDMTVRPAAFRADRLERAGLPARIREFSAVVNRRGILEAVPYESTNQTEHFRSGVRLKGRKPEWRHVEAASLQRSGVYRIVRSFQEDFRPNENGAGATIIDTDRMLYIDTFVETVTLFYMLAARVAQGVATENSDEVEIEFVVDGLAMRQAVGNMPEVEELLRRGPSGHEGSENRFAFSYRGTPSQIREMALSRAVDDSAEVLWSFGLANNIVPGLQRRLSS